MITRNDDNIIETTKENDFVIVQFGASWCYPCKQLKPKVEQIALDFLSITFVYCDIDATMSFSQQMKVMSVPTLIAFHAGSEVDRAVGPNEAMVRNLAEKLLAHAN